MNFSVFRLPKFLCCFLFAKSYFDQNSSYFFCLSPHTHTVGPLFARTQTLCLFFRSLDHVLCRHSSISRSNDDDEDAILSAPVSSGLCWSLFSWGFLFFACFTKTVWVFASSSDRLVWTQFVCTLNGRRLAPVAAKTAVRSHFLSRSSSISCLNLLILFAAV